MTGRLKHLSGDHHIAIANVAAQSSRLEYQIEAAIEAGLRQQPRMAEFLLKNLGTDRIVGLLKAMLLDAAPDEEAQIDNLIRTIGDVRAARNQILHWTWIPGRDPNAALSASSRPFREFKFRSWTAAEIQAVATKIENCARALIQWRDLLHKKFAALSPDKP